MTTFLHKFDNGERNRDEGPKILPFSPGQSMAFVLFSWIAAQEGVKKLVLCDGERFLLLTGCSSTLYLQENSKPWRLTKLSLVKQNEKVWIRWCQGPFEHWCLDSGPTDARLPARWSSPRVWSGCVRRTLAPSGWCSIRWKDLHKQQCLTKLSRDRFTLPIAPGTKGRHQFICLRQGKVADMRLESSTNKSNKSPAVLFFSAHCDLQLRSKYFFISNQRCCSERVQKSIPSCNGHCH